MLRSSDFHVSHAQILHLHVNVNYQCPWCLWYMLTRISTEICTTKLLGGGGGEICAWTSMKFHWYFILHIRGLCGASSGQKAFAVRAGEVHVCLCPCGVSLLCADPCLYQQALAVCGIRWLPTSWLHTWAYGRDAAPCWQKCFGMWCMKRANRNVSVISCEERQMWVYIKTSQRACWQGQGEGEVGVSVLL